MDWGERALISCSKYVDARRLWNHCFFRGAAVAEGMLMAAHSPPAGGGGATTTRSGGGRASMGSLTPSTACVMLCRRGGGGARAAPDTCCCGMGGVDGRCGSSFDTTEADEGPPLVGSVEGTTDGRRYASGLTTHRVAMSTDTDGMRLRGCRCAARRASSTPPLAAAYCRARAVL